MDSGVRVQLAQLCFELVLGGVGGQVVVLGFYSDLLGGLVFALEITGACRVVADLNSGEEGLSPMVFQFPDLIRDLSFDFGCDKSSI